MIKYVMLKNALYDFLREKGISLNDILDAMDEDPIGLEESLLKRINISRDDVLKMIRNYTARQLNLLIFVIQVFYLSNYSGMYKNRMIIPLRDEVIGFNGKITKNGLRKIIKALGLKPRWLI